MTNETRECEPQSPFFFGWRRAALWLIGAGALAVVGYRGTLGTETATAAPPVVTGATPILGEARSTPPPAARAPNVPAERPAASALPAGASSGDPTPRPDAPAAPAKGADTGALAAPTGGSVEPAASANHLAAGPSAGAITPDGRIVLNLATETELRQLPGIGKSRAHAIVEQRERVGRFRRLEDLLRVKGIGPKRLAALRSKLVLDAPEAGKAP